MADRETGIVKWFDETKGYGYIEREMGRDVFVHFRECRNKIPLTEGQRVEYTVQWSPHGWLANDVIVVDVYT